MILNEDLPNIVEWQNKVDNAPGDKKADVIEDYVRSRFNMADPNIYYKVKDIILILVGYIQDNNDKLSDYDNPILVFVDNYLKRNGKNISGDDFNTQLLDTIHDCLEEKILTPNDILNTKSLIYYPSLYKNNPDSEDAKMVIKIGPWLKNKKNYADILKQENKGLATLLVNEQNQVRPLADIKKLLQELQTKAKEQGDNSLDVHDEYGMSKNKYKKFDDTDLNNMSKEDVTKYLNTMDRDSLIKLIKGNLIPKVK